MTNLSRNEAIESIFEQMKAIVEAPGYPLLKNYKDDFYVIDREYLERTYLPGQEYVWSVRESGTTIGALGINERACAFLAADIGQMELRGGRTDIFHVTENGIKEISADKALDLMREENYQVKGKDVFKRNGAGKFDMILRGESQSVHEHGAGGPIIGYDLSFNTVSETPLSTRDVVVLNTLVNEIIIGVGGSLFAKVRDVTLDGEHLRDVIDQHLDADKEPENPHRSAARMRM